MNQIERTVWVVSASNGQSGHCTASKAGQTDVYTMTRHSAKEKATHLARSVLFQLQSVETRLLGEATAFRWRAPHGYNNSAVGLLHGLALASVPVHMALRHELYLRG